MKQRNFPFSPYQPQTGCVLLLLVLFSLLWILVFLVDAAQHALVKLHLSPPVATMVLAGIFLGGLVNIPVFILERDIEQPRTPDLVYTLMGWVPIVHRQPMRTIIAVNVGGCLIPVVLVLFEFALVFSAQPRATWAAMVAVAVNIAVCYYVSRPVQGVGIAMPALTSPAVSVVVTWLMLMPDEFSMIRAPVAFTAGVLGPLIGADLLHLRDISKIATPVASIGGAGTFDGIVLSGLLAAFLV